MDSRRRRRGVMTVLMEKEGSRGGVVVQLQRSLLFMMANGGVEGEGEGATGEEEYGDEGGR